MRDAHPVFDSNVPSDATMWRYFDLPKFVWMLQTGTLYFSRANLLGDPLEGSFTRAREAERQRLLADSPDDQAREHLLRVFKHNAQIFADTPWTTYINCWHLGDHESMAMWQGYGGGAYGVAIRSTFGALDAVLPPTAGAFPMANIYLSRVQYVDYASETTRLKEEANSYAPFVNKSIAYRHESEVRAVFIDARYHGRHDTPPGYALPVDLGRLVKQVTVSPLAPEWYRSVVEELCARYHLATDVGQSIVFSDPVY